MNGEPLPHEHGSPTEAARVPGIDTRVQWVTEVAVEPGMHAAEVRATNATGLTRPPDPVDTVPEDAEGWHHLRFTAEWGSPKKKSDPGPIRPGTGSEYPV
ncbi:hypothetical protein PWG71_27415 [Nocardiopsis sp. N85]|uniref:hypothetical protein n=1 Tax=Nocardiopsis sp. N85 TaxID=3029400 RepID=UPI00237EF949|nr:hypothetical protein [Nocardiopsis sp. N85]MDE3725127.1 hypothetical protein [Nocardiopsis sp. N85]